MTWPDAFVVAVFVAAVAWVLVCAVRSDSRPLYPRDHPIWFRTKRTTRTTTTTKEPQ